MSLIANKSPTIRSATLTDLTNLRLMWSSLYQEQEISYPRLSRDDYVTWTTDMASRLERQMNGDQTVLTILAENIAGDSLGFLTAQVGHREVGSPHQYWLIDHLYVIPTARGGRVGPQLIVAAIDWVVSMGIRDLELVAIAGDRQWERRGWQLVMTRYATTLDQVNKRVRRRRDREIQLPAATISMGSDVEPRVVLDS